MAVELEIIQAHWTKSNRRHPGIPIAAKVRLLLSSPSWTKPSR